MTYPGNYHSFGYFDAAGECGPVEVFRLAFHVIPNLAVGAFTVPAKIAI